MKKRNAQNFIRVLSIARALEDIPATDAMPRFSRIIIRQNMGLPVAKHETQSISDKNILVRGFSL